MKKNPLDKYTTSVCSCDTCAQMCKDRPCWGTPEDIKKIIDAGFRERLMIDYWVASPNIYMLAPAIVGHENGNAPDYPEGRCTFLDANNLCELHTLGIKPTEGKIAVCRESKPVDEPSHANVHREVAMTWKKQTLITIEGV